jgi:8-oxo-dGTP diphosphatase
VEVEACARPLASVDVLFLDSDGHVLIVEPLNDSRWLIPGGAIEEGESPRAACARTVRESIGLELPHGRLLAVDWAPRFTEERVFFVFDGGTLADDQLDAIELPPHELESWASMPEDELFVMLAPDLNRRVSAALAAHVAGEVWYLENGTRELP